MYTSLHCETNTEKYKNKCKLEVEILLCQNYIWTYVMNGNAHGG